MKKLKTDLTDEELKRLYLDEKISAGKIAERYGLLPSWVHRKLNRLGVKKRSRKDYDLNLPQCQSKYSTEELLKLIQAAAEHKRQSGKTKYLRGHEFNEFLNGGCYATVAARRFGTWVQCLQAAGLLPTGEDLKRLYIDERKTGKEIGAIYGMNQMTVNDWLHKLGLPLRKAGDYNGKTKGENHYNWKGANLRFIYRGYVYIRNPNGGKAVLEHRYLMEQHLGRKLTKQETIHHLNAKKDDNRISNLTVVNNSEHPRGKADNYHQHYINRIRELEKEVEHLKSLLSM